MSKLYNAYISLKANEKNNENTLYLFKSVLTKMLKLLLVF